MFWGITVLVMFIIFITAKGGLPTYIGFFRLQNNTSDTAANANPMANPAIATAPFIGGTPAKPATPGSPATLYQPYSIVPYYPGG